MTFVRNPIVIKLGPEQGVITSVAVDFEEAFGEHSEFGRRHRRTFWDRRKERVERRRARRRARRERRRHRHTFWDRRAESLAKRNAEADADAAATMAAADQTDTPAASTDAQQDGGAGADQAQTQQQTDSATADMSQNGGQNEQGSAQQDSGDMNPGYSSDAGTGDENQGAGGAGDEQTEQDAGVDSGEESAQFAAETDSTGRTAHRSKGWELNFLQDEKENAINRYESIRARLARIGLPAGVKHRLNNELRNTQAHIKQLDSEISRLRKMTGVQHGIGAKVSRNRIEVPSRTESLAEGYNMGTQADSSAEGNYQGTDIEDLRGYAGGKFLDGQVGPSGNTTQAKVVTLSSAEGNVEMDDMNALWAFQDTYDKPQGVLINAEEMSGFGGTSGNKIKVEWVLAGVAAAVFGMYLYKKYKK